jgi:hypothetical protein
LDGETGEKGAYNLAVESDWLHTSLQWTFEQMGNSGKMVYFTLGPDSYKEIIQKELEQHPNIQATEIPASFDDLSATSEEAIAALVAKEPDLGGIWSGSPSPSIFWGLNDMQGDHTRLSNALRARVKCNPGKSKSKQIRLSTASRPSSPAETPTKQFTWPITADRQGAQSGCVGRGIRQHAPVRRYNHHQRQPGRMAGKGQRPAPE